MNMGQENSPALIFLLWISNFPMFYPRREAWLSSLWAQEGNRRDIQCTFLCLQDFNLGLTHRLVHSFPIKIYKSANTLLLCLRRSTKISVKCAPVGGYIFLVNGTIENLIVIKDSFFFNNISSLILILRYSRMNLRSHSWRHSSSPLWSTGSEASVWLSMAGSICSAGQRD